jgi:hypothetical protein
MNIKNSNLITIALIVIALNMTYSTIFGQKSVTQSQSTVTQTAQTEDRVLPVVGRASINFDGLGSSVGFVVRDGENFRIVRYDKGSMMDNESFKPKYLTVSGNGKNLVLDSVTVEAFN